jgi:hypothetical protein
MTLSSADVSIVLAPLHQGAKIQWNRDLKRPKRATTDELQAYFELNQLLAIRTDALAKFRVIGPIQRINETWRLLVRKFMVL